MRLAAVMLTIGLLASGAGSALAADGGGDGEPIVLTDHARELHRSSLLIDGHNDLPWELRKKGSADFTKLDIALPQPGLQTDIPRLHEGGMGAQFWSVWVPVDTAKRGAALQTTLEQIELVKLMLARYPNDFELALTTDDIERIHASGKIASLIGVEGGHCIEDSLAVLRRLYGFGARYMTLTHSRSLSWADSGTDDPVSGGLNAFGEEVVREMNRLGMMVDISHVSINVMKQAIALSEAPVIFSHSSCRAIAEHPRNVPDEVLALLPEKDGVVMINFFSAFVVPEASQINARRLEYELEMEAKHGDDQQAIDSAVRKWNDQHPYPNGTIHHVLDHIEHVIKVAGVDHVGLGSDFDGVSVLPDQLEGADCYPLITQGLIDRGYSDADIQQVLGGNLMRVFRKTEQTAARLAESEGDE
ncbi:Membrane dipeptidase (Peptidase family M19) [Pseudobythopirellula maris]|uniref:Membrane dipeptidase (Peptidase family M19) n=1 Tax=Pseudobythopirellula maris TaxID=2527991 RepID=A0A5C5ZIL4_9BACT|nr:dipeptidase [Pseudobythopirellula maris]TWT87239.1 Membrane dipeptidase (Peptidase family M19) [Pseudobythopirellula maris]